MPNDHNRLYLYSKANVCIMFYNEPLRVIQKKCESNSLTHTYAGASRQVSFVVGDKTGELEMSLVFLLLLCVIPFLATSGILCIYSLFLPVTEVSLSLLLRLIIEIALQYHWRVYQVSSIRIPIETVPHCPIAAATSCQYVITRLSFHIGRFFEKIMVGRSNNYPN